MSYLLLGEVAELSDPHIFAKDGEMFNLANNI